MFGLTINLYNKGLPKPSLYSDVASLQCTQWFECLSGMLCIEHF